MLLIDVAFEHANVLDVISSGTTKQDGGEKRAWPERQLLLVMLKEQQLVLHARQLRDPQWGGEQAGRATENRASCSRESVCPQSPKTDGSSYSTEKCCAVVLCVTLLLFHLKAEVLEESISTTKAAAAAAVNAECLEFTPVHELLLPRWLLFIFSPSR